MADETLPTVQGEGEPAMVPNSMVVLAQNPVQMREAQVQMVAWAKGKVAKAKQELAELEENLAIAKKRKWRQSTLKAAITKARKRVQFYYKTQLALEEGYCLVPNFPTGVFAIRTTRKEPKAQDLKNWPGQVRDEESTRPPAGEGRYVDAEIAAVSVEGPDRNGETKEFWTADDEYTEEIPFPFTFVKPQIMEATSRAMAHKIFDDIGCLPKRRARRNVDPIIVGRITLKESAYQEKTFTFLIAWFMDLEQM